MMGRAADIKTVPFFWSAMFGKTLRYAGRGQRTGLMVQQTRENGKRVHRLPSASRRHLAAKTGKNPTHHSALECYLLTLSVCQGYGDGFDDVIIQGDLDELRFVAFYTR